MPWSSCCTTREATTMRSLPIATRGHKTNEEDGQSRADHLLKMCAKTGKGHQGAQPGHHHHLLDLSLPLKVIYPAFCKGKSQEGVLNPSPLVREFSLLVDDHWRLRNIKEGGNSAIWLLSPSVSQIAAPCPNSAWMGSTVPPYIPSPVPIRNFSLQLPRQTWPRSMLQGTL